MELELKYGLNPHQGLAKLIVEADPSPLTLLNGTPGFINLLDAFGAWQLAKELKAATGRAGAASFKHVSPAGAAIARPLSDDFRRAAMIGEEDYSPVACAYLRARGGDPMSSFGDAAAVSDVVDVSLANVLKREVSDLIIAPGYEPEALEILKAKKGGKYLVLQMDPDYEPPAVETRDAMGFTLQEERNTAKITKDLFAETVAGEPVPEDIQETLVVATISLKYTQSNSVCVAYDGQVVGTGAGQQSRVHCTRLACGKADTWFSRRHPKALGLEFAEGLKRAEKNNAVDQYLIWDELSAIEEKAMLSGLSARPEPLTRDERLEWLKGFEGICVSSDAFFPFRDSIDRASRTHVQYAAQPGGSLRDEDVTAAAAQYGMKMIHTGVRVFLH